MRSKWVLSVIYFSMTLLAYTMIEANENNVDLEVLFNSQIVVETKKINIPEYPHAMNPGVIVWQGRKLLAFRNIPNINDRYTSYIGLVWLDDEWNPVGPAQILNTRGDLYGIIPSRSEDPRLIVVGETLYMVYNDNAALRVNRDDSRMYIVEVMWDGVQFTLRNSEILKEFHGKKPNTRERNWTPFEYNGSLCFVYSMNPMVILSPTIGTNSCALVSSTLNNLRWKWGVLRGGTPALLEGEEYLSFFHSSIEMSTVHSNGQKSWHYFMGAYTFSKEPPFHITRISAQPIVGKDFYHGASYPNYWKRVKVIFPSGYLSDEENIWVTYGRDDHELWVACLDKKKLFSSLVPVDSVALDVFK